MTPRVALCLEQTLGHRAHGLNLERAVAGDQNARVHRVAFTPADWTHAPWAVRGSRAARELLRTSAREPDVTLFHTQTISLLAPEATSGRPFVVSIDATPSQIDAMGDWYRHRRLPPIVESFKTRLYRRVFRRAAGFVAWTSWAAEALTRDYGLAGTPVLVAHPGAGPEFFQIERSRPAVRQPRILFVGSDLARKGANVLLDAFAAVSDRASLTIVTGDEIGPVAGVEVVRDASPGSERLIQAYAAADIFCLPTLGDCTPVVIGEAMASGLPVITTDVGSSQEVVAHGETGLLVPPGDVAALRSALQSLIQDPAGRVAMGCAAREHARMAMDAEANARSIIEFMREVI